MKSMGKTWFMAVLLPLLLAAVFTSAADASIFCRTSKGGSSTDALGEEYPELSCWPVLFGIEFRFLEPLVLFFGDSGLGEEFPEKRAASGPCDSGLGEEFPEKAAPSAPDILGEEFPE